jgi:hypothetical protein
VSIEVFSPDGIGEVTESTDLADLCAPYVGDVAILGDKIAAVGAVSATGRREIDACGLRRRVAVRRTHGDAGVTWLRDTLVDAAIRLGLLPA